MKNARQRIAAVGVVLALAGLGFVAGRVWAAGIPATGALSYSGTLEDGSGAAKTGDVHIEIKFWNDPSAGTTALCTTNSQQVTLDNGRFSLVLPDTCTDAVKANPDLYAEVLVDGTSLGRAKTSAVPYAVEAGHATSADDATHATNADSATSATSATNATHATSADSATTATSATSAASASTLGSLGPSDVQHVLTQSCSAGSSIRAINTDGTVACQTDSNTTYSGTSGVTLAGTTFSADTTFVQRRVAGTCPMGSSINTINPDGSVTCALSNNAIIVVLVNGPSIGTGSFGSAVANCPASHPRAIGGGIDLFNVLNMSVTSSGPRLQGSRTYGTAPGQYGPADGWQGSARNDTASTVNPGFVLSVICSQ